MAAHWKTLLVGVALLQGILSLSPIPIPEEEWEQFYLMMSDPSYRLPTTTLPRHYDVNLTPYFENVPAGVKPFSFDGTVVIYISATVNNVNEIVMHCNDLTISSLTVEFTNANNVIQQVPVSSQNFACEAPQSFLRIPVSTPLVINQEYRVLISFKGNLQDNMRGFYKSWYKDSSNKKRWMATTQFQPGHARQAFPCYDEPGFKATFDITMNREQDFSPTISNMPIKATENIANNRVKETFHTTPVTSTYLLAFIVSHYKVVASNNNVEKPFNIYARDNAGKTGDWSLEIGEKLLTAMDEYTDIPYYDMATELDMKQAAIPDFSAGAMENWGLLTYREALILYDPENSNHFYKQRVANIVAHEIAHMWFGNLVTCAWWNNLWLNEGFARFYQYYLTGSVAPELGYSTRFIVEQFQQQAMAADSVDTAHALTETTVESPSAVSAHFSSITYARGASILRMTLHLLGEQTYVKGLRKYLKNRAYKVAEPQHLFQALDEAASEDKALEAYPGITIDRYFRTWSEKAGHPLLSVSIDQNTGRMVVSQARWERTTGVSKFPSIWDIPITWTREKSANFDNLKPSQFLTAQATVMERGSQGNEWVIFNKQSSGFYRVNYDQRNWALLTQAMRKNPKVIHEYNRAQIVDDLFNLGRSTVQPYERVLNILSFLKFDDEYAPWIAAIDGFNFAIRRLAHDNERLAKLRAIIHDLSTAVTARLGYAEVPNEPFMDGLLRMYVMTFLCDQGHEKCIEEGKKNFANWRNGGSIPPNMRPWVYCTGLREGNAADFDYFWQRYLQTDLAGEQVVMLQVAGCTRDQASLEKFLSAIVADEDLVRPQDFTTALNSAVSKNEFNTLRALEWLKKNIPQVTATLGSIATPLSYIGPRLLNENDIQQYEAWLNANQALIGSAYNTGINGANTARNNLAWSARRIPEFDKYFETGYVEDDIDDETTVAPSTDAPTEPEVTDAPAPPTEAPEGEPDSANIATLSAFTLLVTLAINFVN